MLKHKHVAWNPPKVQHSNFLSSFFHVTDHRHVTKVFPPPQNFYLRGNISSSSLQTSDVIPPSSSILQNISQTTTTETTPPAPDKGRKNTENTKKWGKISLNLFSLDLSGIFGDIKAKMWPLVFQLFFEMIKQSPKVASHRQKEHVVTRKPTSKVVMLA